MSFALLGNGNPSSVWSGETSDFYALNLGKDVLAPIFGIQERNFAIITLVIQICDH